MQIFAKNLRDLLLQKPVRGRRILGLDPAYRTGCKVAAGDEFGSLLDYCTVFPHQPQNRWKESLDILQFLVAKHGISLITIGNGRASRETELLAARLIAERCPVYSASVLAKKEFPDLDVSLWGAVPLPAGGRILWRS